MYSGAGHLTQVGLRVANMDRVLDPSDDVLLESGKVSLQLLSQVKLGGVRWKRNRFIAGDQTQGIDLRRAVGDFWVGPLLQRGMLIAIGNVYYICSGACPGLAYVARLEKARAAGLSASDLLCTDAAKAWRLRELPCEFRGPLPRLQSDEARVPVGDTKNFQDPLESREAVPALILDMGETLACMLMGSRRAKSEFVWLCPRKLLEYRSLPNCREVKVFAYSLHVTDAMVERETGIMKLTASDLAALLTAYGVSMPKSSTNANKIRGLMRTDEVRSQTSEAERNRVEDILSTQEAKRKKKAKRDDEPEPVDDEDEQANWDVLREDPAMMACSELLRQVEEEDKQERLVDEPAAAASVAAEADAGANQRASCSASYNPEVTAPIREGLTSSRDISASERSQGQAYFICWKFLEGWRDSLPKAKRRRTG
ncbi:hypothetical protein AK812_SmicGene17175 [Symbiodinium microadriaticum]|uniref:Uncharacterized protein n=1 Tax=Symbiodinium microadriaticum TaxID=2951 RepID=A0A1Q9DYD5_SYMMI|nr:hypothetical protein AK812_SmicGene17175 [Symbiodinium microadriaticum]